VIDGRKRAVRALASLCAATCLVAVGESVVASPSDAKPDVESVQSRVDTLYRQAEQASERYNDARLEMRRASNRLSTLQAHLFAQQYKVDRIRSQVADSVVAQAQGQDLSSTSQLLLSDDPQAFLDQLATVDEYRAQQGQMMADFADQVELLDRQRAAAAGELRRIAETKKSLGTEKAQIDRKAADAKKLLATLKDRAAERASRSGGRVPVGVPASGRAAVAVRYAMAQVGKAYVFGAAGPSAFDCSGLTMRAWGQAGVGLPHSSSAQMSSGRSVSKSQLQPGDLVFYYSPVSHVGMYIGGGQIVNAENPGVGVRVTGLDSMPYSGAVRPG